MYAIRSYYVKKNKLQEHDNKRKNLDELLEQIDAFFRESTWERNNFV